MSLATIDQFRGPDGRLDQYTTAVGVADESRDTFLQECLDEATSIITTELGFALTAAAAGTQTVYGNGTVWLLLPLFTPGSVSLVTTLSGQSIPDYVESGSALRVTDSRGVFTTASYVQLTQPSSYAIFDDYSTGARWAPGVPYTVTADYGISASDMVTARMCCLEIATGIWKFRDAGGATAVGTESAVVVVKNAYSPIVQSMLGHLRRNQSTHYSSIW